ncbi:MAG: YggS family pyridoxal phosphate-dependent enzyme [Gammaproteobacteria bacterium]|nr:YggS family pyridoxal phosphate-dependent enzyme [Gammaproteobacteria bacterium]
MTHPENKVHNDLTKQIQQNLAGLKDCISAISRNAGRSNEDIKLIAVSKTQPVEAVRAALEIGHRDFGENTIQDALTKIPQTRNLPITWHFIGHLQSRKAKEIPGNFQWLHSLDNLSLAGKLDNACRQEGSGSLNILLQVNITQDPNKFGIEPGQLDHFMEQLLEQDFSYLIFRGLMTIGPYTDDEADQRRYFSGLRELRDQCRNRFGLTQFTELSMGMSNDYPAAIREGATMIRIGSAIFGERQ